MGKTSRVDNPLEETQQIAKENDDLERYFVEELFPLALTYGMTTQEFWYDDPSLMWSYRIFYENKQKETLDNMNLQAWLNGLYVYDGVSKAIGNAFRKKNTKAVNYLDSPIDLSGKNDKKQQISNKSKKQFTHWAKLGERSE